MALIVNELVALTGFAFVGSVTPGPNNTVLLASGLRFGFRRTLPHILGTALGIGALVLGVAAGIGVLFDAVPASELALKVAGSAYLLYLAFLVSGSRGIARTEVSRPLSLLQAVAFQCVNPKAWIFAIVAVGTFLPPDVSRGRAVALLMGVSMVVIVGSSSIWAAGGAALRGVVDDERSHRLVGISLAVILVTSVVFIWL